MLLISNIWREPCSTMSTATTGGSMKHPSLRLSSAFILAFLLAAAAVGLPLRPPRSPPTSTAAPAALPPANGDVIRTEPSVFYVDPPLKTVRAQAAVQRVMYRSVNSAGVPVAVTGTVLVPSTPWIGAGARPLVGYGVGTQGQGDQCAPSGPWLRARSTRRLHRRVAGAGILRCGDGL